MVVQVSEPYRSTDFTLVLKIRILVLVDSWAESQIGLSILKAWRVFLLSNAQVHVSVSSTIPADVTAQVGEVLYFFDGLSIDYDGITGSLDRRLIFITLVFPVLILSPS